MLPRTFVPDEML